MGSETFRVKKIPDPTPYIAGKKEGFISRENLIFSGKIIPRMPSDFEFNYSFNVLSFKMVMQRGFETYEYKSESSKLTEEMIQQIRKTNRGQAIVFDDIVARGPEGTDRVLSQLIIYIN